MSRESKKRILSAEMAKAEMLMGNDVITALRHEERVRTMALVATGGINCVFPEERSMRIDSRIPCGEIQPHETARAFHIPSVRHAWLHIHS